MLIEKMDPKLDVKECSGFKAEHPMFQYQSSEIDLSFRERLRKAKKIIVIGMGGSTLPLGVFRSALGLEAVMELWSDLEFSAQLLELDIESTVFCLVSKSGTTLEVQATAASLLSKVPSDRFVVVSDEASPLEIWAKEKNIPFCKIPKEIGGRFTNFTDFHRVLMEALGFSFVNWLSLARSKIETLKKDSSGLERMFQQIFGADKSHLILWSYGRKSLGLAKWMQQVLAESLGKLDSKQNRKGIFPIVLEGPQDQHSVLQYLTDGPQDHVLWFLESHSESDETLAAADAFPMVAGQSLAKISAILAESTYRTFQERLSKPETSQRLLRWKLGSSIEAYIEAIVTMQAFIEYAATRLGVNAYDQPGVERGKQIAKDLLKSS